MICSKCQVFYKTKHTCAAGTCTHCHMFLKNLPAHKCPVQKLLQIQATDILPVEEKDIWKCEGCLQVHLVSKNCNGFHEYRGVSLCTDCFRIPEIQMEIQECYNRIYDYCFQNLGLSECAMCKVGLLMRVETTNRVVKIRNFEFDHVNMFNKTASIFQLVYKDPFDLESIKLEVSKCRMLCVRCHSYVTFAEKHMGLHHRSIRSLSEELRNRLWENHAQKTLDAIIHQLLDRFGRV